MAAISAVFTIDHVARMLGEEEEWLWELSILMFPEHGCLHVYGIDDDGVPAFTADGIENLRDLIRNLRARGEAPPPVKPRG